MKIKFLLKNVGIIFVANLLMGCASQLIYGDAIAQEAYSSKTEIQGKRHPSASNSGEFVSRQQEYMYKILVAEIARLRGNNALAAEYFFEVAVQSRDPRLAERATQAAWYAEKYNIAMEAARLWVTLAPNNPQARQILGSLLLRQQRTDEVVVHLEAMLDSFEDKPQQLSSLMAAMLEQQQDQALALELMKKLVAKRPNNSVVLLTYSRFLIRANQLDQALEVLRTLLTHESDHAEAVPLYAYLLDRQGKLSLALQWMRQALHQSPDQQEWRLMYARMLADAEQFEESIKQFKLLLGKSPHQKGDILYALGVLSLQVNQPSAAKRYFMALLERRERLNTARYYLGQIAQEEKDLNNALSWYKQIEGGSNYLNAQAQIALILAEQGQLGKAIEHLRNVPVERQEETINLRLLEAELLVEQKRYRQAMETYNRVLKLAPDNTEVLYMRAMLAEKMGRIDQLERDLRRVLELEPENADALNALGYSLTEHTDRYQEAYELIKQAFVLNPTDYYILDSMGWVLYKMGNLAKAIAYLRKAQATQYDPEIAAHLGEVLWVSGEQRAAKEVWKKALETFPDDEQLREVVRRFLPFKEKGDRSKEKGEP